MPDALRTGLASTVSSWGGRSDILFAEFSDQQMYDALIQRDANFIIAIADRLAALWLEESIELVMGDAEEGYNTIHDLCRAIIDAAVQITHRRAGRVIANYACHLTEWINPQQSHDDDCLHLTLDAAAFVRKQEALAAFAPWDGAIGEAADQLGLEHFRTECLRGALTSAWSGKAYYEEFAEARVHAGKYAQVIRYHDHVRPLKDALQAYAESA